jgi:hypothetical protein
VTPLRCQAHSTEHCAVFIIIDMGLSRRTLLRSDRPFWILWNLS